MKKIILLLVVIFLGIRSNAQSPGGVSGYAAWYKGDAGLSTTSWSDQSPNGYNLSRTSGNNSNNINFNPVASFGGVTANQYNNTTTKANWPVGNITATTYYYVAKNNSDIGNRNVLGIGTSGTNTGFHSGQSGSGAIGTSGTTTLTAGTGTATVVSPPDWDITKANQGLNMVRTGFNGGGTTGRNYISAQGGAEVTNAANVNPNYTNTANFRVGSSGANTAFWTGDVAEVIVYSGKHTPSDYDKIESYLSLKYGITKANNYVNSTGGIVWNVTTNSGYNNNIAGIARDNNSGLHQKQSLSQNSGQQLLIGTTGVANSNASNTIGLTNGQFLVWGDNGASKYLDTAIPITGVSGVNSRFSAIWKAQNTGNLGTIRVMWPVGSQNIKLIVSDDTTFTSSDSIYDMSANIITIDGISYNYTDVVLEDAKFFTFIGYACAPGGVMADLKVWLKGDDGFSPSIWYDRSGNNNHYIQPTTAQQPAIVNGVKYNFNPTVDFNSNTRNMYIASGPFSSDVLPGTIFVPTLRQPGSGQQHLLAFGGSVYNSGTNEHPALGIQNTAGNVYIRNAGTGTPSSASAGFALGQNEFRLLDWSWIIGTQNVKIGRDGESFQTATTSATYGNGFRLASGSILGKEVADFYYGDIPEVIMYERQLTATELSRVRSYLAIKYGVTLFQPQNYVSSIGSTVWNSTTNTIYNNNIFGIGRDLSSCLNQKVSTSLTALNNSALVAQLIVATNNDFSSSNTSIIRNSLNDGQYLMFGDNNNNTVTTSVLSPSICPALQGDEKRIAKEWMVQNTNNVGANWLQIDMSAFDINSEVFLLVSDDAGFTTNVYQVPGTISGGKALFYALFSGVKYFTVGGKVLPYTCTTCTAGSRSFRQRTNWTVSANRTANSTGTFNVGTPVGSGQITTTNTVTYTGATEYLPNSFPQSYGSWARLSRRDNATGSANRAVYTTQFNAASKVSFKIRGINKTSGQTVKVEVRGYCGTGVILPKLTYEENRPRYRRLTIAGNIATGTRPYYWNDKYTGAIVTFDKPVEKIEVIWYIDRVPVRRRISYLLIGDMKLTCENPLEPNTDNVYITQSFDKEEISQCETATMKINIKNLNCTNRIVNISNDSLPAGMVYDISSYVGPGTPTITSNNLTISNLTVPSGDTDLYIDVIPTSTGLKEVQATYDVTIASGGTGSNLLSDDDSGQTGLQTTKLNITPATIPPMPEITLSQNSTGCGLITYTVTFNNNTGSPVSDIVFETDLDGDQRFVNGSVSNAYGGTIEPSPYTDENGIMISGMTIPTGISSFTFQVNNFLALENPLNSVSIIKDPSSECSLATRKVAESPNKVCETCENGVQAIRTGEVWQAAGATGKTSNAVSNISLTGTAPDTGTLSADISLTYPSGVEWLPNNYPRKYGKWLRLSRRDRLNATPGEVKYQVNIKDASGNAIAAKPSFQIAGINTTSGQRKIVKVVGYCGTTTVLPVMNYAYNKTAALNTSNRRYTIDAVNALATGVKPYYDLTDRATLNVEFEKAVDRIEVIWSVDRPKVRRRLQFLYIGDMTLQCENVFEENADNVHLTTTFVETSLPSCEEATMKIKITNENCDSKEINITNTLPTDLAYVSGSYIGLGSESPTYSGQNFSLSNLVVPSGNSYLYIKVNTSNNAGGTYNTYYNYTINGGTNSPNPYRSDDNSGRVGFQDSEIVFTPSTPFTKPTVMKTVNECYSSTVNKVLTYTVTIKNNSATQIDNIEFNETFEAAQSYIPGTLSYTNFIAQGTAVLDQDPDDSNRISTIFIEGMSIAANATATLTYQVNVNPSDMVSTDTITDLTNTYFTNVVSVAINPDNECGAASTVYSDELQILLCKLCYKPGIIDAANTYPTKHGMTALGRAGAENENWPMIRQSAWTVLESKEKGFVINRVTTTAALANITNPVEGMIVYDEQEDCLKIYTLKSGDTLMGWHCFITPACPD